MRMCTDTRADSHTRPLCCRLARLPTRLPACTLPRIHEHTHAHLHVTFKSMAPAAATLSKLVCRLCSHELAALLGVQRDNCHLTDALLLKHSSSAVQYS